MCALIYQPRPTTNKNIKTFFYPLTLFLLLFFTIFAYKNNPLPLQIIAAPIAINTNINTVINATAIRLLSKNLAIKIIFYINFIGKNLKPVIK